MAQPKIIAVYGQEAKFVSGGEVPVDLGGGAGGGEPESATFGISARLKVNEIAPDRLRVLVYVSHSDLDAQGKDSFLIRESAVRCVRTIRPGEAIAVDLDGQRKVKVTITPVKVSK